jgi:hypothetical protein
MRQRQDLRFDVLISLHPLAFSILRARIDLQRANGTPNTKSDTTACAASPPA